jgi:glycosyltransferase involved in cell wall biosynthesis
MSTTRVYLLAKNEAANIERCLASLAPLDADVVVLDSGSTDGTQDIVARFDATLESYSYSNHCNAYNELAMRHQGDEVLVVLDADMQMHAGVLSAIVDSFGADPQLDAVLAPVDMYWVGQRLAHGSLYPPKPVAFRGGREHFERVGHGEQLRSGSRTRCIDPAIVHDDRRPHEVELAKQWRYAKALAAQADTGRMTWRDRVRYRTPLMILAAPAVSYLIKGGFRAGRIGVVYALDRVIAEALAYRASQLERMQDE